MYVGWVGVDVLRNEIGIAGVTLYASNTIVVGRSKGKEGGDVEEVGMGIGWSSGWVCSGKWWVVCQEMRALEIEGNE